MMNFRNLFNYSGGIGSTLNVLKDILGKSNSGQQQNYQQTNTPQQNSMQGIEELSLLFETLYEVLVQKGYFTNQEFQQKFDEIDMRDGVKDGKNRS